MKCHRTLLTLTVCLLASAAAPGCIEEKCDPGYKRVLGSCFPVAPPAHDAGQGPLGDAAAASGEDADAGAEPPPAPACDREAAFGKMCTSDAECACDTTCIPVLNLCSKLNCLDDPAGCPEGWTCTDVSAQSPDPTVTSLCLQM